MRLDKYLADAGIGTRSEAKNIIRKKQVKVNSEVVCDASCQIDPAKDSVTYMGQNVFYEEYVYYMLNKPAGCVSATRDNTCKTVLDLLSGENIKNLFPVGRLDKDTEGLLLITNNGALAHNLLAPGKHVKKTYLVYSDKALTDEEMQRMESGIDIGDDSPTFPATIKSISLEGVANAYLLTISEGRYHQVKRMFKACGLEVVYLKRLSMGEISLDESLSPGSYRRLTDDEVKLLPL